ncbi:ATP-binding cassette domain-containing protein [Psychromonas sp. Urea-02u-13]|uniref:ATP-binding cassette domain-containing protein n=1 Tax=Psychromonas sp. Urea-02u-13 TaxID=2058326 RepID=UPI000C320B33|nr:ATP-binding cassette domain-containing protein [Psychromonas sp. Urea-02u-13]PKG38061.1 ABC transporter ATP-binding protein [Psychromonas sp. Urea-02u-13]
MNNLKIKQLSLRDQQGNILINNLSFEIKAGEVLSLMGPSGCGKSTLLHAIAGHPLNDFNVSGEISLNGKSLNSLAVEQRQIGFLFQEDLLFPHLNIWQNLAFALPDDIKKKHRKTQALIALEEHNLLMLADKNPSQISGGQRARVSMIRLLLAKPQAVLLDEPFNKLDQQLRQEFRQWVFDLIKQNSLPVLMVTHDQEDIPLNAKTIIWPEQQ